MQKIYNQQDSTHQAFYKSLVARYGDTLAKQIMTEISRAQDPKAAADYMGVKLLSEVLEEFPTDWFGYRRLIQQSWSILYRRAMDQYESQNMPTPIHYSHHYNQEKTAQAV